MERNRDSINSMSKKIDNISGSFNSMQDLMLAMKNELNIIKKGMSTEKNFAQLSLTARKQVIDFLDNKDTNCKMSDACVRLIEGGVFKILSVYSKDEPEDALKLIDKYLKTSNYRFYKKKCDNTCLDRAMKIYRNLKELIMTTRKERMKLKEEINALGDNICLAKGEEDNIHTLISPLSNVMRLKILISLQNGGRTYSQLEEYLGIKAGHLLFHVEKLIKVGYMSQENKLYLLTARGLKIIKYLNLIKEELL